MKWVLLVPVSLFPEELTAGMVGYITASLKNVEGTRVGDTVTDAENPCKEALPGYKKVMPMVYCGLYPADGAKYQDLRDALEKIAAKRCFPCSLRQKLRLPLIWLPLWIFRTFAFGSYSGAFRERI